MTISVYIDPTHTIVTRDDGKNIGLHVDEYTMIWGPPEGLRQLRDTIERALARQREPESVEVGENRQGNSRPHKVKSKQNSPPHKAKSKHNSRS